MTCVLTRKAELRARVDVPLVIFADETITEQHPGRLGGRVMLNPPLWADDSVMANAIRREENT